MPDPRSSKNFFPLVFVLACAWVLLVSGLGICLIWPHLPEGLLSHPGFSSKRAFLFPEGLGGLPGGKGYPVPSGEEGEGPGGCLSSKNRGLTRWWGYEGLSFSRKRPEDLFPQPVRQELPAVLTASMPPGGGNLPPSGQSHPESLGILEGLNVSLHDQWGFSRPPVSTGPLILNPFYPDFCFPVAWPFSFHDSFGEPRENGRPHLGIDIFAEEGTEVYAVTDGTISRMALLEKGGLALYLAGKDGKGYIYMHLQRFAPALRGGQRVRKGEVIGYVGRTGTVNSAPHLHFQVHADARFRREEILNPYEVLVSVARNYLRPETASQPPRFCTAREITGASPPRTMRPVVYLVDPKSLTLKPAGLHWRIPPPTWKISPALVKLPPPKPRDLVLCAREETSGPSSTPSRVKIIVPFFSTRKN